MASTILWVLAAGRRTKLPDWAVLVNGGGAGEVHFWQGVHGEIHCIRFNGIYHLVLLDRLWDGHSLWSLHKL